MQEPEVVRTVAMLHQHTFPEVLASKRPISDAQGYLMAGPDRKGSNAINPTTLWLAWQRDVQAAKPEAVPAHVLDFFVRTKHLQRPPTNDTGEMTVPVEVFGSNPPLNTDPLGLALLTPGGDRPRLANPPRFATSFSGMQNFMGCPFRWAAEKFYKTVPYVQSEAAKWGDRVHKTAENYVLNALDGGRRPVEPECLLLVKRYCDFFLSTGSEIYVEKEMCFTKDLKTCGWKDWSTVWFRGKADLLLLKDRKLLVVDFKSGKKKDDPFQLEVMIACASLYFDFDTANGKLIFLKEADPKNALCGLDEPVTKEDIPAIWEKIFAITNRMEEACKAQIFRKCSSGLCKSWCDVPNCEHNGKFK